MHFKLDPFSLHPVESFTGGNPCGTLVSVRLLITFKMELLHFGWLPGIFMNLFFRAYSPKKSVTECARIEAEKRLRESGETFGYPFPADYAVTRAAVAE